MEKAFTITESFGGVGSDDHDRMITMTRLPDPVTLPGAAVVNFYSRKDRSVNITHVILSERAIDILEDVIAQFKRRRLQQTVQPTLYPEPRLHPRRRKRPVKKPRVKKPGKKGDYRG